jgi:polyhydroxyalkanoate synthesis regulator phasin|tara:strand:- start:23 stop:382 length:360 start_codon:yes stop_codon:yes gene_type:complete
MICKVLNTFKAKTATGEVQLYPEQIIKIQANIAEPLIEKGKIKSIDGNRLYRDMLQRIDRFYRKGDLAKIEAKHKTFLRELEKKELKLLDLIYKGKDCRAIVEEIEKFIKETIGSIKPF